MTFDIVDFTEEELFALSTVQMRLLRTAQQNKDELTALLAADKRSLYAKLAEAGMLNSNIYADKCDELDDEYERQVAVLKDNLIYNMSLNVPGDGDDDAGDTGAGSDAPYIVAYTLSYLDRYLIVRNYYMSIEDPAERLALYGADTVAQSYLGHYYNTLYNVFSQYI